MNSLPPNSFDALVRPLLRPMRRRLDPLVRWRLARRLIAERRRLDGVRFEEYREANQAEILLSGERVGSPGWLIRTEMVYSPRRDRHRASNSPLSPSQRLVNSGGDKMGFDRNGYAPAYSEILDRWIGRNPLVVELGVFRGSGLAVWCDLFPEGRVIGLDVSLKHFHRNIKNLLARGAFSSNMPELLQFDAYESHTKALQMALDGRPIDVFIDDGPHKEFPSCLLAERVRPLLAPEFTYIIEDVDIVYGCLHRIFADCDVKKLADGLVVITERVVGRVGN